METQSIKQMKDLSSQLKEALKPLRSHNFGDAKFGAESEYTSKSIIAGIDAILVDLKALYSAPAKLIKKSTATERSTINSHLISLTSFCSNSDLASAASIIDQLKPALRAYGVRDSDDRRVAFEDHIDSLQKKAIEISKEIEALKVVKTEVEADLDNSKAAIEEARVALSELTVSSKKFDETLKASEGIHEEIETIKSSSLAMLTEMEDSKAEVNGLKDGIDDFSKKIQKRELQLESQDATTSEYKKLLEDFTRERIELLGQANSLIESARTALGYKTAQGLSAAFTEKQIEAKSDRSTTVWIFASAAFILAAIGIGIWITVDSGTGIELIVGRLSLIPILIGGAWFSASQYVKQRNLAEEYAYKSVLVRSMVGFSEQISNGSGKGEDHSHYIKNVLAEIHMNPLRGHKEPLPSKKELIDLVRELRDPISTIAGSIAKGKP